MKVVVVKESCGMRDGRFEFEGLEVMDLEELLRSIKVEGGVGKVEDCGVVVYDVWGGFEDVGKEDLKRELERRGKVIILLDEERSLVVYG